MGFDSDEFVHIIDEHSRMIYKIAGAYSKTSSEREDIISETVLQLWRTAGRFKGNCKISTWVYRVALNTAMNFNRKQKKESLFLTTDFGPGDHFKNLIEAEAPPELEVLYLCIDELDEINKAIILLYLDGNQHDEIAEIIGMSKTNIGTRIGRIKEQLKKSVKSKI